MKQLNRREILGGLAMGTASLPLLTAGCVDINLTSQKENNMSKGKIPRHDNDYYYTNGKLDVEKAKNAYYEMMAYYDYPIVDRLKTEDFWVLDFALGKFTEVGMGGIFWVNHHEHNYLGHEIFLLPGQIIPEHWHVGTTLAGPKLESWHCRYGHVYLYSEGEPTPGVEARIPPTHRDIAVARTESMLKPGEIGSLLRALSKHWMRAGDKGAIVSEYATYHDMAGLRFSHPDIKL